MKYIIAIIAAVAIVANTQAQQYNTGSITTVVAASTTSNYTSTLVIALTKYEDLAIWSTSKIADSGTDATTIKFARSVDGTTYETTPSITVDITNTGTTSVNAISNITVGAVGYIRLASVQNADASGNLTNTITWAKKPQRFGK